MEGLHCDVNSGLEREEVEGPLLGLHISKLASTIPPNISCIHFSGQYYGHHTKMDKVTNLHLTDTPPASSSNQPPPPCSLSMKHFFTAPSVAIYLPLLHKQRQTCLFITPSQHSHTSSSSKSITLAPIRTIVMSQWNERYSSTTDYVYGTKPNDFLSSVSDRLPPTSTVLSIGEGEGRNALYLAQLGHKVTGVDASSVGIEKAQTLMKEHGVLLASNANLEVADLATYELGESQYDGIVSIFCHLPPTLRKQVYKRVVSALKPNGILILEAYTPKQLEYKSGGPPVAEMMCTLDGLREELEGLEFEIGVEMEREVVEGTLHTGLAHVVQVLGRKK